MVAALLLLWMQQHTAKLLWLFRKGAMDLPPHSPLCRLLPRLGQEMELLPELHLRKEMELHNSNSLRGNNTIANDNSYHDCEYCGANPKPYPEVKNGYCTWDPIQKVQ